MNIDGDERLRFGDFEFDRLSGRLFRDGRPVKIQPQPLRVLGVLIERPGEIIFREELRSRVWGDATFVEFDQGLNYCIRQVRVALRDGASDPLYIETLPKQGYRFIGRITGDRAVAGPNGANPAGAEPADPSQNVTEATAGPPRGTASDAVLVSPTPALRTWSAWRVTASVISVLAIGAAAVYPSLRFHRGGVKYTQLTDFTDSRSPRPYRRTAA